MLFSASSNSYKPASNQSRNGKEESTFLTLAVPNVTLNCKADEKKSSVFVVMPEDRGIF